MINTKLYKENLDLKLYTECANWCNANNATIIDKGTFYEVVAIPAPTAAEKLAAAKQAAESAVREQLAATDYKCLKYVDGDLTAEEYQETKKERQALREKFNAVEACATIEDLEKL